MSGAEVRKMMLIAADLKMVSGDYAFFTLDVLKTDLPGIGLAGSWKQGDADDAKAKDAYRSLFVITLEEKSTYPDYIKLEANAQRLATTFPQADQNAKAFFTGNYKLTYFAAAYYDCVMYAALAYRFAKAASKNTVLAQAMDSPPQYTSYVKDRLDNPATFLWGDTILNGIVRLSMFLSII
ncbi:hypothetical protein BV898_08902 [Hypsibius exemplaris]|uniref:Receptor ligand binding region domain-containing protein n=1 Tax=Hypsibius exemplaris TaxID=2072580 RepID=A0A1W0WPA7_HYPEX|nr:hypothetical protein BV898_08902 [Hypsibius exemplaris]